MRGNIIFAIELIFFVFLFSFYISYIFRIILRVNKNFELFIYSIMMSFVSSVVTYAIAETFLEPIYLTSVVVFWLVFLGISTVFINGVTLFVKIVNNAIGIK